MYLYLYGYLFVVFFIKWKHIFFFNNPREEPDSLPMDTSQYLPYVKSQLPVALFLVAFSILSPFLTSRTLDACLNCLAIQDSRSYH